MNPRIATLSLLMLCLAVAPAIAGTIYENGPINGTIDAWSINAGFAVSNTFSVGSGGATITGLSFGAWLFPGDLVSQAEVSITSAEFGGITYFDQFLFNFTQSNCSTNQYGFNVCVVTASFSPVDLAPGSYWLNLQNVNGGLNDPVYWDENSGPSSASENQLGTIPSESFTILGSSGTSTVPEPSTLLLFGSGILGLAGVLHRKLF